MLWLTHTQRVAEGPAGSWGKAATEQSPLSTRGATAGSQEHATALLCPRSSAANVCRERDGLKDKTYWEHSTVTYGKLGCPQVLAQGEAPQGGQGEGVQPGRQTRDIHHETEMSSRGTAQSTASQGPARAGNEEKRDEVQVMAESMLDCISIMQCLV